MTLKLIKTEVLRFLATDTPEVLCIKGKWGVGKTYGWKTFLEYAKESNGLELDRYSYVSLFGLNSLDDFRFAIFEKTVTGANIGNDPDVDTFGELIKRGGSWRKIRPTIDAIFSFFRLKDFAGVLLKATFLMVRKQIICVDDLERAGAGLAVRDVLGLVSHLKEEKSCKIVLLLNDEEHDERDEFARQLEKVADVTLTFDLTASEAVEIALKNGEPLAMLLRPRIVDLGITNIRAIKKIERLALRLFDILRDYDDAIVGQAVAALVLATCAVQQPKLAPPLDFIRAYNRMAFRMKAGRDQIDDTTARYLSILENYPFDSADQFDLIVIEGAAVGYFRDAELLESADLAQERLREIPRDSRFSWAWKELYHGSLATDDDDFLDEIYESALAEAKAISLSNINAAIRLLRECERGDQADQVITSYITAHEGKGPKVLDISSYPFASESEIDVEFRRQLEVRRSAYVDTRDPFELLSSIGRRQDWDERDVALMATQSADDFERMFETLKGEDLGRSIRVILNIGLTNARGGDAVRAASLEALRRIGRKSPLRARKIRSFGVELEPQGD